MKKTIGIIGGMGPMATADLLIKITNMTKAGCDNDHAHTVIDCDCAIPDRTGAILHGGPDPVPEMSRALRHLELCGADCVIMACNTAHHFLPRLQPLTKLPILNMTAITAERCAALFPGKHAALLGTTGTLRTGLYNAALERAGVPYLLPEPEEQAWLMHLIYDVVKATKPLQPEDENWSALLRGLRQRGADYFVLACTELPIAAETLSDEGPFVDPTAELARAALLFCGYEVKEKGL